MGLSITDKSKSVTVLFVFFSGCALFTSSLSCENLVDSTGYNAIPKEKLLLFPSLQSVMDVLHDPKYRDLHETKRLLFDYNTKCLEKTFKLPMRGRTRKPFIVIEGNQRTSRKIVARRVARRLGATYLVNPPPCLAKLTNIFPYGSVLRRSYFGLCMYANAKQTARLFSRWPVCLNGYYYDQASFSIAQVYANTTLPPPGSSLYAWPRDLLKPDIIFYLDFPDNLHHDPGTTRHPSTWKPRMMEVYKSLNDSSVVFVSTREGLQYVEDFVVNTIVQRLSGQLDFTVYASRDEAPPIRKNRKGQNTALQAVLTD